MYTCYILFILLLNTYILSIFSLEQEFNYNYMSGLVPLTGFVMAKVGLYVYGLNVWTGTRHMHVPNMAYFQKHIFKNLIIYSYYKLIIVFDHGHQGHSWGPKDIIITNLNLLLQIKLFMSNICDHMLCLLAYLDLTLEYIYVFIKYTFIFWPKFKVHFSIFYHLGIYRSNMIFKT